MQFEDLLTIIASFAIGLGAVLGAVALTIAITLIKQDKLPNLDPWDQPGWESVRRNRSLTRKNLNRKN